MVSSKKGPSSGSGLSKRARRDKRPLANIPSSATSTPGTYSSTRKGCGAGASPCSKRRSRTRAASSSPASLTRITPRLPDSSVGLTTQGKVMWGKSSAVGWSVKKRWARGAATPAACSFCRMTYLLRAASAAPTSLWGSPSRALAWAASSAPLSSTANMACNGRFCPKATIAATALSGWLKSSPSSICHCWANGSGVSITCTSSTSSRSAAAVNAGSR